MSEEKKKVHFTKITEKEKLSKLNITIRNNVEITVWIKGRSVREHYKSIELMGHKIKVYPSKTLHLVNNDVLFKFEINGVNYFSQGKLTENKSEKSCFLTINAEMFKSERRTSYRLLTYPIYDVQLVVSIPEVYQGSNVVDIKTGVSQTKIFKSFLNIIGQNNEQEGYSKVSFRVQDISVTGLSFVVGDVEREYFRKGQKLTLFNIYFDGELFDVEEATIVYMIDYFQSNKKGLKQHKVGIRFENVTTNADSQLGRKINEVLRTNESNDEFEDFIK
jgi:hypothetical protein